LEASKITFLISSHDLNHVTEICDRIVLLEKGKVIRDLREKGEMLKELEAYFVG
jgi:ABC-2 type transport system ATP-binding protein